MTTGRHERVRMMAAVPEVADRPVVATVSDVSAKSVSRRCCTWAASKFRAALYYRAIPKS